MPTLVELHYDKKHQDLKQFLGTAVATAKASASGAKFVTYVPVSKNTDHDVAYISFRDDDHASALSETLGNDTATKLAEGAKGGVKAVAHASYELTDSQGSNHAPAPYILLIGLDPQATKSAGFAEAATALRDANAKSASPVDYHVLKSSGGAPTLLAFPMQSLSELDADGALNEPRLHTSAGAKAAAHAEALKVPHSRTVLAYVPGSSNP